jgi:hypothetical protein
VHPEGLPVFINEQPTFYLLIPVFCKNCSFMVFFNAGKMLKLPSYFPEEVAEPEDEFPEVLM